MGLRGTDNPAMVWDSSDKLGNGTNLTHSKTVGEVPRVPELPDRDHHRPSSESLGVGHMQRPKHPTS